METQKREQLTLPMEIRVGFREKGYFSQGLEGPVGVYQAEDRVKNIPDTKEAHFPFFIVYLEPKLSPILARQQHRNIESRDPQVTVLS